MENMLDSNGRSVASLIKCLELRLLLVERCRLLSSLPTGVECVVCIVVCLLLDKGSSI